MEDAAARAALQVLHVLHARTDYSDVPLDVLVDKSRNLRCVKALERVPAEALFLAPCALKTKSLSANSVHPYRAQIHVEVLWPAVVQRKFSDISTPSPKRRRSGELGAGSDEEPSSDSNASAVAAGSDETPALTATGIKKFFTFYVNPEWKGPEVDHVDPDMWTWQGDEAMHPYWSIRRLTQQRLGEATFNMKTT